MEVQMQDKHDQNKISKKHKKSKDEYKQHNSILNELIMNVGPCNERIFSRKKVISIVENIIDELLASKGPTKAIVYQTGSFPLRTFLIEGDIDITIIMGREFDSSCDLLLELKQRLEDQKVPLKINGLTYINSAKIKVLKLNLDGFSMDVTFKQFGGILAFHFLEKVDELFKPTLLKQCILLAKAFIHQECRLLGSNQGMLATQSLEVMVLYVLNAYHHEIGSNLQLFFVRFIKTFAGIDFEEKILTFCGPVSKDANLNGDSLELYAFKTNQKKLLLEPGEIETFKINDKKLEFSTKNLNILDPINSSNNIGLSVSKISAARLKNTFERVAEQLKQFSNCSKEEFEQDQQAKLLQLFGNTTRVIQSLKNQEHLLMSTINCRALDTAYEVGKIGSQGVRQDTLSLRIRPQVRFMPNKSITKDYVASSLDTFKPRQSIYKFKQEFLVRNDSVSSNNGIDKDQEFFTYQPVHENQIQDCKFKYGSLNSSDYKQFTKKNLINSDKGIINSDNNNYDQNAQDNMKQPVSEQNINNMMNISNGVQDMDQNYMKQDNGQMNNDYYYGNQQYQQNTNVQAQHQQSQQQYLRASSHGEYKKDERMQTFKMQIKDNHRDNWSNFK